MAAFYYGSDDDAAWIEECGENGDGCTLCGGDHEAKFCPVFPEGFSAPLREDDDEAFASDDEIEASSQNVSAANRTMADLVYEFTGEDVNGIDSIRYRQLVKMVQTFATPAEIERYMIDGTLPACCDDGLDYCLGHSGIAVR